MNVGDWLGRASRAWGDRVAVVDTGRAGARFTYAELDARAGRLARWLRDSAGVREGDRVGMLALNGVEYLDAFFACSKLGATFVPFNWRQHVRELLPLVERTAPRALVFSAGFGEAVRSLADAGALARVALLHAGGEPVAGSLPYEPTLAGARAGAGDAPATPFDDEAIACLLFTGGTTGAAKAARISWRQVAYNTLNTLVHEIDRFDVTITHTPMFHTGGLLVHTVPVLTAGGTVVIMPKWTADEMLALIERERVTALFCVPTQYQMMLESPAFLRTSFRSVRFLTSGGAPLPVSVARAYREAHGVVFKQGFGMTEFGPGCFSMGPEFVETKAGSVGRPNFFVDARVVDEDNRPLPAGVAGELVLRGPGMCSGYDGDDARRGGADAEGWFHTGDVARVDDDGFFFIVDRVKDMFISGGENVYPAEVERALYEHPAVLQCAVIGVPDAKWGEVGRAVVVRREGASVDEAALLAHCAARLARYKVPRSVVFADAMPLSPAGKILKRELRERYGAAG